MAHTILGLATIGSLSSGYRPALVFEFRLLGPLEVVGDSGQVPLGGLKQRATLAILLLNANRVVSVDRLADDLYAGKVPVTAVTQVQRQISALRKSLGSVSAIETRPPGYLLRLVPGQLDLERFERLASDASRSFLQEDAQSAADLLREALALWRGAPLADLAYESFAQTPIERLEEIRLAALEQRIDADLLLGRHAELVGELEQLVGDHPLHERFRAQLMLTLYRAGRQAEALDVYRRTRAMLVGEFGIEPTPALHELERAILAHDASLDVGGAAPAVNQRPDRAVLVAPSADDRLDALLAIAEPLTRTPGSELIIARLLASESDLEGAAAIANNRRASLSVPARTAVFTTSDPPHELARLAAANEVGFVLLDAPSGIHGESVPKELAAILEQSPADVGLLSGELTGVQSGHALFVPFGGGEHDWAALEFAAWLASAAGGSVTLVGTSSDPLRDRRDASRLLADASLAVQRVAGVDTQPRLAEPSELALIAATEEATLVVVGISPRWRREGIGTIRRALIRDARPPVILIHRGPRPGGLAPSESRTRFTWSIGV
jgi:DNA-binding SARP family transcriptional activator